MILEEDFSKQFDLDCLPHVWIHKVPFLHSAVKMLMPAEVYI